MALPVISPWLFGKRADFLLFGGSAGVALLFLGIGYVTGLLDGDAPPWLFLIAVVGVDVAHVWSTGWRVLAYLAVFHFVRQQYGWVSLYRRKNGEGRDGRLLDAAAIYGATLTPLLFWHAHLPRKFQWFLKGDFLSGLPEGVSRAAFVVYAGIFAAWVGNELARARAGRPVSWGKILIVFSTAATWFLGIVVFDSDYAFTVLNVFVHGIPYMGLVWFTSKARAEARRDAGEAPSLVDRMVPRLVPFLAPLLLVAFAEEWGWDRFVWHDHAMLFPGPALDPGTLLLALIVPLLALPQATHYVWDAFLWKVKPANAAAVAALGIR